MPQAQVIFEELTVLENMSLHGNRASTKEYCKPFPKIFSRFGQLAGTMSGGEKKILSFIRTMAENGKLIILDEPSEGVQQENIEKMAACIIRKSSQGCGVILIEQNLNFVQSVATHYLGIESGEAKLRGCATQISGVEIADFLAL